MSNRDYLGRLLKTASIKNADDNAEKIYSAFPSLDYIIQLDDFTLSNVSGCNQNAASFLKLCAALTSRRITDRIKNVNKSIHSNEDLLQGHIAGLYIGLSVECVYLTLFDAKGKYICDEMISEGTVNASGFLPRMVLDVAMKRAAKYVIISHNHPRGTTKPSSADIASTEIVWRTLSDSHIMLLNHFIVSGFDVGDCFECVSAAHDRLAEIRKSLGKSKSKK